MHTITVERRSEPDGFGGAREGLIASVTLEDGTYFSLSRLNGEDTWIVDAHFGANGFPFFSHGFGARYTMLRTLADASIVADLDAHAGALA